MARKHPLPKRVAWLTAIGLFSCWALLIGCGKKGPPVVPGDIPIAAVADLDGELEQTTVTLTWTHPKANARIRNYVILRAPFERGMKGRFGHQSFRARLHPHLPVDAVAVNR